MTVDAWVLALDALEARLAGQRAALHAGATEAGAAFAPPPSLGPLPAELHSWAAALLQETTEVQAQLSTALAATGRDLRLVRRLMAARPAAAEPRYLDQAL